MKEKLLLAVPDSKVPMKVKISYAVSGFGRMLGSTLISVYSMFYYTTVLGLDGAVVGTIILLLKIWDFLDDPMFGALCDRTRSKEGRCRFWLRHVSVPGGIIIALMFMIPNLTTTGKYIWLAVTYILQSITHTALCIPSNALMGRLTLNTVERSKINQYHTIASIAGTYLVTGAAMPLINAVAADDMKRGFAIVGIISGILYSTGFLVAWVGTKGHEPLEYLADSGSESDTVTAKGPSVWDSFKAIVKNGYWLLCVGITAVFVLSGGLSQSSMVQYYLYNLGNTNLMSLYSTISLVALGAGLLCLTQVVKRFGNAGGIMFGSAVSGIGMVLRLIVADHNFVLWAAGSFLVNFGGTFLNSLIILCLLDSRIYGRWKTGVDNDAILMSGHTLASKIGFAVASSLSGILLSAVHYSADLTVQTNAVLNLLFTENLILPLIGYILTFLLAFFVRRLEVRLPEMTADMSRGE